MRLTSVMLCVLIVVLAGSISHATVLDTVWTHSYVNGLFDSANCVQETSDGGLIVAGSTRLDAMSNSDILLIKTLSDGTVDWTVEIGDSLLEEALHILETSDGGFLISALSYEVGDGSPGTWIVRTDALGDTLWTYAFNPEDRNGFPLYAIETNDSGFAITGRINLSGSFNEAFILKLDADGNYLDYDHYNSDAQLQDGWYITQMSDSGFIVAGMDDNYYTTGYDFFAFRTTEDLTVVWDSSYALSSGTELMHGACRVSDGIVLVGYASGVGHAHKIDFDGNTVWSESISQTPFDEWNNCVCPTVDDGVMVGGWHNVPGHRRDFSFIELNSTGKVLRTIAVGGSQDDHGQFIVPTSDGGWVMAGSSQSFTSGMVSYLVKIAEFPNTPIGSDIAVAPDSGVTLLFDSVTTTGETSVTTSGTGPVLPTTLTIVPAEPPRYYDIASTATYEGVVEICLNYDPADVTTEEADLTLMHHDGSHWVDITSSVDTMSNIICGQTTTLSPFAVAEPSGSVDVGEEDDALPDQYRLLQNYPNPFNPSTTIAFELPVATDLVLTVYNMLGERVRTLATGYYPAGAYVVTWDGTSDAGEQVASGVYMYRLGTGLKTLTEKMLLLK